jgi:hypothetical protein
MTDKQIFAADPAKPDAPATPAPAQNTPPAHKPDADKASVVK